MKKRILSCLLALVMIIGVLPVMALAEDVAITPDYSWYTDGATEFTNATPAQLLGFENIVNGTDGKAPDTFQGKKIILASDIDLAAIENWTPIGKLDASVSFMGEFDGNGKTISNLTIAPTSSGNSKLRLGLFASPEGVSIHDLTLKNTIITQMNVKADARVGALDGNMWYAGYVGNVIKFAHKTLNHL